MFDLYLIAMGLVAGVVIAVFFYSRSVAEGKKLYKEAKAKMEADVKKVL